MGADKLRQVSPFNPGETTKSYTFTWRGALPVDHTYPEPGGVQVTSPNQLTSPLVAPTGQCTSLAAFQVTKFDMAVSPTSIQGLSCGTSIVVTYTATIYVAANSPGGTVQFSYTVNNGRGQTRPASSSALDRLFEPIHLHGEACCLLIIHIQGQAVSR